MVIYPVGEPYPTRPDFLPVARTITNGVARQMNVGPASQVFTNHRLASILACTAPAAQWFWYKPEAPATKLLDASATATAGTHTRVLNNGATPTFLAPQALALYSNTVGDVRVVTIRGGINVWGKPIAGTGGETVTLNGTTPVYTKYCYAGGLRVEDSTGMSAAKPYFETAAITVEVAGQASTALTVELAGRYGLPFPTTDPKQGVFATCFTNLTREPAGALYNPFSDEVTIVDLTVTRPQAVTVPPSPAGSGVFYINVHDDLLGDADALNRVESYFWAIQASGSPDYAPDGTRSYLVTYIPTLPEDYKLPVPVR